MTSEERGSSEDDFSLNIAGHEEEKREREGESADPFGGEPDTAAESDSSGDSAESPDESAGGDVLSDELDVEADAEDDEAEPVELLVQLAEEGEIEPWDIDIVTVTDKFLDRLDGADLRTSGRALFYASVLLRMKSDAMLADDDDEETEPEDPWDDWGPGMDAPAPDDGEFPDFDPVEQLEDEMERRLDRKSARGSPETLDELVRELRERERGSWWKESRSYDTTDSPSGFQRGTQTLDYRMDDDMRVEEEPSADDVTGTAHAEDIEAVIDDVREELRSHYDKGRTEVLYAEIETVGGSRIQTFLALLFLSHRGTVTLEQDDMFGDLWVEDGEATEEPETPAIAD
ncbi:segregation/condensation protein A [Halorussus gelatinilyticus]|uniref:Segregation/condensation protein A n=1 Tax=Halorussus gelatinilyticus TaxID=2937524 RepID=A0A8U0IE45_9EURY|nr:ScpA family protein [Halorussus gelatinilyticus]UPV99034.1 segregation/condensation protein A [Halorussus gelatinilyticus]